MQNRYRSASEAGFVTLSGGWSCPRCGCANDCCDACHACSWNRCGCQGGVVRTAAQTTRTTCGCAETASQTRSRDCDDCPASFTTGHRVQCCPDNTRIRRDYDCGCQGETTTYQTRSNGCDDCGCKAETTTYQTRGNGCDDCGCKAETTTYQTRSNGCDCGCKAETTTYQTRSNGCDCGCNGETTAYQTRSNGCDDCGCKAEAATYQTRSNGCDDCGCKAETTTYQTRSNGCDDCGCKAEAATYQTRSNGCDCGCKDDDSAGQYRGRNRGVGIVHAVEQELADVYESESALRTGTLFPELHKPLNGRCPGCSNCSTCEQQSAFAAWDLRLYLNTHPDDKEALALFRRLENEAEDPNYATTFLDDSDCGWSWTENPWPWECQDCGK